MINFDKETEKLKNLTISKKESDENKPFKLFKDAELDAAVSNSEHIVLSLGWYFPWGKHKALASGDDWSRKHILDLKDKRNTAGQRAAIHRLTLILPNIIQKGAVIAIVPSSTKDNPHHGITMLAQFLATNYQFVDGTSCLERTETVNKAATGGSRDEDVHQQTITIKNKKLFKDQPVLLLDDVVTTGASLRVCENKLLEAGAKAVVCLTLGHTYSDDLARIPIKPTPAQQILNTIILKYTVLKENHAIYERAVNNIQGQNRPSPSIIFHKPEPKSSPDKQTPSPLPPPTPSTKKPPG